MNTKLRGDNLDIFYVFPVDVFISYASEIHMAEANKRQRKPHSANYRNAWDLILQWAAHGENSCVTPAKFGETSGGGDPEPSSESRQTIREGVET